MIHINALSARSMNIVPRRILWLWRDGVMYIRAGGDEGDIVRVNRLVVE